MGPSCTQPCPPGTFGPNCTRQVRKTILVEQNKTFSTVICIFENFLFLDTLLINKKPCSYSNQFFFPSVIVTTTPATTQWMENANAYLVLQEHVVRNSVKRDIGDTIAIGHVNAKVAILFAIQRKDAFVGRDIKVEEFGNLIYVY